MRARFIRSACDGGSSRPVSMSSSRGEDDIMRQSFQTVLSGARLRWTSRGVDSPALIRTTNGSWANLKPPGKLLDLRFLSSGFFFCDEVVAAGTGSRFTKTVADEAAGGRQGRPGRLG